MPHKKKSSSKAVKAKVAHDGHGKKHHAKHEDEHHEEHHMKHKHHKSK